MKQGLILLGAIGVYFLTGCAAISRKPLGVVYSDITDRVMATSNSAGNRVGESCSQSVLGLVAWGDAGIELARRNGGISTVSAVDEHTLSYFGVYTKLCTIVRGK